MISSLSSLGGMVKQTLSVPSTFTISPTVDASSVTILGVNYKVYTFTNTTSNFYTITKSGISAATIYYMCVGAGGSGFVGGGGGGQFQEGSISVVNPQTMTLSVGAGAAAGNRGSSSTMEFSVETAKNITSYGGFAGTGVGGTSGDSVFAGGSTSSYGGGGGGVGGAGQNGSGSGGGDGGLPKKTAVAGILAVYPNTWWAAGGPGGYVAGNSYAGAGSGTSGYGSGKGISTIYPGYNTTIANNPNARNNTGSGGGSSNPANTGGSGIIVLALPDIITTAYPPFTTNLTGGDITYTEGVYVLTFKSNGTLVFKDNTILPTTVNYLLVGGGGTGGVNYILAGGRSGPGGAGGHLNQFTITDAATLIKTHTVTVGVIKYGPNTGGQIISGFTGNPTSIAISGGSTYTANGGQGGQVAFTGGNWVSTGGVGQNGGASGGGSTFGGGGFGSIISIRGTNYYFSGGGSAGNLNNSTMYNGGRGGGGGFFGNNGTDPYLGPNGISQNKANGNPYDGYNNSGGGGGGANYNSTTASAGGSGIAVVWFTYP